MSRTKTRGQSTDLDRARDELFSHIHRCGVLKADTQQQSEWMDDTIEYFSERFPELSREQLTELREIGLRFCSPVIVTQQDDDVVDDGANSAEAEAAAA